MKTPMTRKLTLKTARLLAGLTQTEIARTMGVSQPTINSWESGASRISRDTLRALVDLYGVNLDELDITLDDDDVPIYRATR